MRRVSPQVITESGVATVAAVESGGSNANLTAIEESDSVIATGFLGSANAAINGVGAFDGNPTSNYPGSVSDVYDVGPGRSPCRCRNRYVPGP